MPPIYRLLAFAILLVSAPAAAAGLVFETKTICRTAIATIMDRDPKLVQATDAPDGVVVLTYARPFDNFVFSYRCRLDGDHVVWADEPGRWRDGAKDAKVSFEVVGATERLRIIVSRANGTTAQQLFDRDLNEVH
ncbi:MAG: hypothetical protein ABI561_20875 [Bradyrhizobium sp.]